MHCDTYVSSRCLVHFGNEKNGLVELTFDVYNQNDELVLKDTTEMIVKCKPVE